MASNESNLLTASLSAQTPYTIIHIPHDETGIDKYIAAYKGFRLLSLELAPEAFASSYAREVEFSDSFWYSRLSHPGANTFLAMRSDSGEIVSASSILGPLPYGPTELSPLGNPWTALDGKPSSGAALDELHFRINAIFTLPDARRQGISKMLIETAVRFAMRYEENRKVVVSLVVEAENLKAIALYEKCGFVVVELLEGADVHSDAPQDYGAVLLLVYRSV